MRSRVRSVCRGPLGLRRALELESGQRLEPPRLDHLGVDRCEAELVPPLERGRVGRARVVEDGGRRCARLPQRPVDALLLVVVDEAWRAVVLVGTPLVTLRVGEREGVTKARAVVVSVGAIHADLEVVVVDRWQPERAARRIVHGDGPLAHVACILVVKAETIRKLVADLPPVVPSRGFEGPHHPVLMVPLLADCQVGGDRPVALQGSAAQQRRNRVIVCRVRVHHVAVRCLRHLLGRTYRTCGHKPNRKVVRRCVRVVLVTSDTAGFAQFCVRVVLVTSDTAGFAQFGRRVGLSI
jgi:hypothetical protein